VTVLQAAEESALEMGAWKKYEYSKSKSNFI
jgi:hypothetical protein